MLELQPPKPRKVDPAKAAEDRSYERAYNDSRKKAAQAKGAADGMADALADAPGMDAVVNDARQRHLAAPQSKPSLPKVAPTATTEQQMFVEVPARGKQYRVPDPQWYSLTAEQKSRFLDAIDGAGQQEKDESVALQSLNELMDLLDRREAKARAREAAKDELIAALVGRVEALEAADRNHRVEASEELAKQQTQMADAVINAASVEASLRNQTAQSQATHDQQGIEAQARLQAMEQPISQLEGRVKSSTTLMTERGNAVVAQVAEAEGRQARLGVSFAELEGQADALGRPITRAEMQDFVRAEVQRELDGQVTDDKIKAVVSRNYTVAAPSSSVDAMNPKPVEMVANVANDEMEREVKAALKRGGK